MKRLLILFVLSTVFLYFNIVVNAQIPPLVFPEGVGVNIHFTRGHEKDLDMIAEAGFKFVRMDFVWGSIERKKGEYDWSAYEELTANLEKRGLGAIYILDYSNSLYEDSYEVTEGGRRGRDTASPQKPESVAAFAKWSAAAVSHFKGRKIIWEIWNEPNIGFWKPKPDVQQYITLVKETVKAIRTANPDAKIIAPASSEFPWKFLESMFEAGLIEGLDAISVHPYRSRNPETALLDYSRLRGMIEKYASPLKQNIPIISGEWGYATHTKGVSLETQAAYIVRQQLINLAAGIPLSIWYDWKNDGSDTNYNEHNFGTVTQDLKPKSSYIAIKTATTELRNCRFVKRLTFDNQDIYVLLFTNNTGNQKLAVWTVGKPEIISIKVGAMAKEDINIVSWNGDILKPEIINGELKINANQNPLFISLKTKSRELMTGEVWKFEEPIKTLVYAGQTDSIRIPMSFSNPFDFPVKIDVKSLINEYEKKQTLKLSPASTQKLTLTVPLTRHDIEYVKGSLEIEYMNGRDNVSLGKWSESLNFTVGNSIKFDCVPVEGGLKLIIENPNKVRLDAIAKVQDKTKKVIIEKSTPSFSEDFPLSNLEKPFNVQLLNIKGQLIAQISNRFYRTQEVGELNGYLDGDAKVPAKCFLIKTNINQTNAPIKDGYSLEYEFNDGWRFIRVASTGEKNAIQDSPKAFGVWVLGDNSKNTLRMRIVDETGQVFQPNGPSIDWTGWRWVKFDLANLSTTGHWGGARDGVVHGKTKIDTLLILDGSQKKTSGKIIFGNFKFIYE